MFWHAYAIFCYICSDRRLKRLEKLQEDVKTLLLTLEENFVMNNRVKHGVPSDSALSPSVVAPTKSLHHREDQILPKPNPEDAIFWSTKRPQVNCTKFGTIFFLRVFWPVRNFVHLQ